MKQRSIYAQIAFLFVIGYTLYSFVFWIYQTNERYKSYHESNTHWSNIYIQVGSALLDQDKVRELAAILDDGVQANEISYYTIRRGAESIAFASPYGASEDKMIFPDFGEEGVYSSADLKTFFIHENGYFFAVGYKTRVSDFVKMFYEKEKAYLFYDILFVFAITMALLLYSMRDLRVVLSRLRKRSANRGDLSIARSSETLALIQGIRGFQTNVENAFAREYPVEGSDSTGVEERNGFRPYAAL